MKNSEMGEGGDVTRMRDRRVAYRIYGAGGRNLR